MLVHASKWVRRGRRSRSRRHRLAAVRHRIGNHDESLHVPAAYAKGSGGVKRNSYEPFSKSAGQNASDRASLVRCWPRNGWKPGSGKSGTVLCVLQNSVLPIRPVFQHRAGEDTENHLTVEPEICLTPIFKPTTGRGWEIAAETGGAKTPIFLSCIFLSNRGTHDACQTPELATRRRRTRTWRTGK